MVQNDKYIEQLLEIFFEGLTSNEEEQILYKYFSEDNKIAPHLEKYRLMFQYFGDEIEGELKIKFGEEDVAMVGVGEVNRNNTLLKKWIIGMSAIAASLLLLFLINPFSSSGDFNPYEGSYVKKDGVFIYDKAEIEEERVRVELLVEQKLACLDKPFLKAEEILEEHEVLENLIEQLTSQIE